MSRGFFHSEFGQAILAFIAIMLASFVGTLIAGDVLIAVVR